MINYDLARDRNLNVDTIKMIEERQDFRKLLGSMYTAGQIGKRIYVEEWTSNEYKLQDLWGFERDPNFHKFWEMDGCTCPTMDNRDAYPYQQIVDGRCPLHGFSFYENS
jgi:hypothetical protein